MLLSLLPRVDPLDDQLRHKISRRGFAAEYHRAWCHFRLGIFLDPVIQGNYIQHVRCCRLYS